MNLDEAIQHAEEVADSKCDSCGSEHKQLAEWLKELKEKKEKCKMIENKCGDCLWLTKLDTPISTLTHYCKLHYTSEIRRQNEQACKDFTERDSNDRR